MLFAWYSVACTQLCNKKSTVMMTIIGIRKMLMMRIIHFIIVICEYRVIDLMLQLHLSFRLRPQYMNNLNVYVVFKNMHRQRLKGFDPGQTTY